MAAHEIIDSVCQVITTACTLASFVAATTPTPRAGSWLSKIYRIIDLIACNIWRAKDKGDD